MAGVEIPESLQPLVTVLGVGAAVVIAGWKYATALLGKHAKPGADPEVAVVGGALADRAAMERLSHALEDATGVLKGILVEMQRKGRDDELSLLHRRIDDLLKDRSG